MRPRITIDIVWTLIFIALAKDWTQEVEMTFTSVKIDGVVSAYEYLTQDVLDHGGYLVRAAHDTSMVLRCSSGVDEHNENNQHIGNLSVLQLGLIDVYHVVFDNVKGDNDCNSST
eukprot:1136484_1